MYRCSKPLLKACIEPALSQADIYFADTSSFSSIGLGGGDLIGKHITQVGACMCVYAWMYLCICVWHGYGMGVCMCVCMHGDLTGKPIAQVRSMCAPCMREHVVHAPYRYRSRYRCAYTFVPRCWRGHTRAHYRGTHAHPADTYTLEITWRLWSMREANVLTYPRLNSPRLASPHFASTRLASTFGLAWLASARLGSTRVDCTRLDSTRLDVPYCLLP